MNYRVAEAIFFKQEIPFLHINPDNDAVRRVYEKPGFRLRREMPLAIIKRVA